LSKEKILVTSALPYANGKIHLGHLSGAYLPADIFVRYHRLKGTDILYVCGSDEHGVPITLTADKEKVSPQVIIDRFHNQNKEAFERFGMDFDIYSRTSIPIHHETAKDFFKTYYDNGLLIEKKSMQFYDETAKIFLPDRYVEGTCPKCGYEEARSDECENCGSLYDPSELKNPKSKISGSKPVLKETSHWYFPLGKFQQELEEYIKISDEKFKWKENVLQYCKGWFKDGLKDRAYTRDLDWGVKVPAPGAEGKVMYVWFEAVLGYISATKELSIQRNLPDLWKDYWQDISTKYVAFIGKDNIVFHTIIFPAMLMAWNDYNNDKYLLPQNVPANEFLNFEGKKFSKSRGWGIDVSDFLDLFSADSLRYYLASNLPESKDSDFYLKEFQLKNNSELADILGNFINRTFTFAHKNFEGKVPALKKLDDIDKEMQKTISDSVIRVSELIEKYKIKDAVFEMMNLSRAGNKYFNDSQPWVTAKSDSEKCGTTINICLQTIFTLAELFSPVIPFTTKKMFKMLNKDKVDWFASSRANLEEGHPLGKAEILFNKIEDDVIEKEISKLGKIESENIPEKFDEISIDDFFNIQLRIGKIYHAENIPKSDKLLKLQVDLGFDKRQIVAGIAKYYNPNDLIGKKVVVVANLKPAKLFGNESKGMILALEDQTGGLKLLEAPTEIPPGTRAK